MKEDEPAADASLDGEQARWLGRVLEATRAAIDRQREFDDPAHSALVAELQAFHDHIAAKLER